MTQTELGLSLHHVVKESVAVSNDDYIDKLAELQDEGAKISGIKVFYGGYIIEYNIPRICKLN